MELGLIDKDQLTAALAYQRQWGHRLGTSLVAKGFISEGTLIYVLSRSLGIPMVDLSQLQPQKDALKLLPSSLCEAHEIVPLAIEGNKGRRTLVLAMADPLNIAVQEEVSFTTGCRVKPVIASFTAIGQAIRAWMRNEPNVEIQSTSYAAPARKGGRSGTDEDFTLVHRGGDEMVVSNTANPGPPANHPLHSMVGPQGTTPPPVPFGSTPLTNPSQRGLPPVRTPAPWTPNQVISHSGSLPALPPLPPLQGPTLPPYAAPAMQPVPQQSQPHLPVAPPVTPPLAQHDPVEELEKKFWALMRVLARKGLITKEEFLRELQG